LIEAQRLSRPDKVLYAYPPGVTRPSPEAEMRQVDNVLLDRQSLSDLSRQPEMAEKVATTRPAVQFYEAIPEDMVIQPDSGYQQDATAIVQVRTPETGNAELETVDTVYHTARRDKEGCREEPVAGSTQRTKER